MLSKILFWSPFKRHGSHRNVFKIMLNTLCYKLSHVLVVGGVILALPTVFWCFFFVYLCPILL